MGYFKSKLGAPIRRTIRAAGYDIVKRGLPSNLPPDFSDAERALFLEVAPYTMTPPERIISLSRSVEYVIAKQLPGVFVECGVAVV